MTTSLIIATYNWPRALHLCLQSIMRQSVMPTEIIIADDGSGIATRDVINHFSSISPVPIHHIWHEDIGFRLTTIRNKAIAASSCDYVIQVDGDVILERHFIQDHMIFARDGFFVSGARAMVTKILTDKLLSGEMISLSPLLKGVKDSNNAIRFPWLATMFTRYKPDHVKGCNMAFWRKDLIAVNGYDESFVGWGFEETELADRLRALGKTKRAMKFRGVIFHLYHPLASRENVVSNREMRLQSKIQQRVRCENGLDQHQIKPIHNTISIQTATV